MELSVAAYLAAAAIVLAGAVVRGITGFGASLIWVSGLSLLVEPDEAVPIIFGLEVLVSAQLFPSVRREVQWQPVRRLLAGVVVGLPVGAAVLLVLDPAPMRIVVGVIVLASTAALARGVSVPVGDGAGPTVGTGVLSGVLNGAASTGGPPVIVFFMGSTAGMTTTRASLIAFFGLMDAVAFAIAAATGLVDASTLWRIVALVGPMVVGAAAGARVAARVDETSVRRVALVVLMGIAVVIIATGVAGW